MDKQKNELREEYLDNLQAYKKLKRPQTTRKII